MSKVLIVAGEPSGEEHALSFLPQLIKLRPDLEFWGVGGERLKEHGVDLKYHLSDFSSMGFTEVISKIPFYKNALSQITAAALSSGTKDAILIDFQDFNLRLAQRLAKNGIRVWYYVAPQAWAWRPWRAKTLAKTVHRLFTILPFEQKWFSSRGVKQLTSIPHPLMKNWQPSIEKLKTNFWDKRMLSHPRIILLPGSRASEVRPLLPIFVETIKILKNKIPDLHVTISKVDHLDARLYDCAKEIVDKWISPEELPETLLNIDVALAASGTVTLGTGIMGVPTVVTYQSSLVNEFVVRKIIKYEKAVSLTNLILDEMVFPEFLQQQVRSPLLAHCVLSWLNHPDDWNAMVKKLSRLPSMLSGSSEEVFDLMAQEME
ncbi:MAG: lipid-A-disaccharide synthase [Bacteriovoracaceae bacterium]|nr:lipid-A-disaccharide synthase [Bacteriovoracaceae bacterium]